MESPCPVLTGWILTTDPWTHRTAMLVRLSPNVCQSKHLLQPADSHCTPPDGPHVRFGSICLPCRQTLQRGMCLPVESIAASESKGPRRKYPWHQPCSQSCEVGDGRLDAHSPRPFLAIDVCRGDSRWTHQVNRWGKGKAREGPEQATVPGKLQLTGGGGMTKSHKGQGHGGE